MIGGFDVDLVHEFFQGFVNHALVTLHIDNLRGDNAHHQCETVFKAFARALRMAAEARPARAAGRRSRRPRELCSGLAVRLTPCVRLTIDRRRRLRHGQPALGVARRCEHVAPGARRRRHRRPGGDPRGRARGVAGAGRDAATACASSPRVGPARGGARGGARASRCSASASACRCCSSTARSGDTPGLGLLAGRRAAVSPEARAARRQRAQGAAHGLEPRCARRARTRCGRASRRRALLFRAQLLRRARRTATLAAAPARLRRRLYLRRRTR